MNDRRPSDIQITAALRAHLPAQAQTGLPQRVRDAVETTSQRRPLPSFLGALSDADPVAARRSLLIAAALLLALALASAGAVGAGRLLQHAAAPNLDLRPPLATMTPAPSVAPDANQSQDLSSVQGFTVLTSAVPSSSTARPGAASWTATGTMVTARSGHTATLLLSGKVLVAGGKVGDVPVASAELYDPNTGKWTATGTMVTPRLGHTATLLPSGKVLVAGGGNALNASAELFDPGTGTWTVTGNMVVSRALHTATLLPDGRVLVAGGFDISKPPGIGGSPEIVATAELYDPRSGTWSATGTMSTSRRDHTATLLPDGTVLVVGGARNANPGGDERGPEPLDTAELYHPLTGVWTTTGRMDEPMEDQGATLLPDGNVLAEYGTIELVRLYDSGRGTWSDIPFPDLGGFVAATLLRDGTVLTTFADRDVELYDPATGSWAYTNSGSVTFGIGGTATLLDDGTVLVAGGEKDASGDTKAAEVYHPGSTR
jgi:Galactose oxidase, central domain